MRILLNDTGKSTVGSTRVHSRNMGLFLKEAGADITWNDWNHYDQYDVVVFGKSVPIDLIREARSKSKTLLMGDTNPSDLPPKLEKAEVVDFFVVGSLEERDYYLKFGKPVLIFPQIEIFSAPLKAHSQSDKTIIGYHGNKMHIEAMSDALIQALNRLNSEFNVSLHLLYNVGELGEAAVNEKLQVETKHIQWSLECFETEVHRFDIGIVPSLTMPSPEWMALQPFFPSKTGFPNDYTIRFKNSTNVGRALVFFQLGIPVVADMAPCHFSILSDPRAGYIAMSEEGWFQALRELAISASLRNDIAKYARGIFDSKFDTRTLANSFLRKLTELAPK